MIYLASPSRGDVAGNARKARSYAERYMRDNPGTRVYAPHGYLAPGLFDDAIPEERELAMAVCGIILSRCEKIVLCGPALSDGMISELIAAARWRCVVEVSVHLMQAVKEALDTRGIIGYSIIVNQKLDDYVREAVAA